MSNTNTNGGPAFPASYYTDDGEFAKRDGMTLRDYFAAKAMHKFLNGAVLPVGFDATELLALVAARAYEVADAMLKARGDSK